MLWPTPNAGSNLSHSNTLMTTWMHRMCKKWCTSWYAVICCRPKNGSLHWHLCIPSYDDILWNTTGLLEADKAKTERNQIKPATGLTSRWMIPTPQTEWMWANASFQVDIDVGRGSLRGIGWDTPPTIPSRKWQTEVVAIFNEAPTKGSTFTFSRKLWKWIP